MIKRTCGNCSSKKVWQIKDVQRTETSLSIIEMEPKNVVAQLLPDPSDA